MHYGIDLPTSGEYADIRLLADLAEETERAGWDGFFLYDQIVPEIPLPLVDPWIALTAAILKTSRIRLGTLVTPLARRRPWKVARETATLDHLSAGRLILGVGLGVQPEEFDALGEESDPRKRAAMLDEALDLLALFWSGQPFHYSGKYYHIRSAQFLPASYQKPHIPIWVGGTWPRKGPFLRAARWEGAFPHYLPGGLMPPDEFRSLVAFISSHQSLRTEYDLVLRGTTPADKPGEAVAVVAPYAQLGLTWWLEGVEGRPEVTDMRDRIRQGPPRNDL